MIEAKGKTNADAEGAEADDNQNALALAYLLKWVPLWPQSLVQILSYTYLQ